MTKWRTSHQMPVSNEDKGSPAVCGRFNNGLQHVARFSHVAYCSGPAQLAFLLAAFEVCGVVPGECIIEPFRGSAKNDDLETTLVKACLRLGMPTVDAELLPTPTLRQAFRMRAGASVDSQSAFWYCQGAPHSISALRHMQKTLPGVVFEYYDGLGTYIAALEQERKCLSLPEPRGIGDLSQLAVQRLMRADIYFMPDDDLWQRFAPPHSQARTRYVPLSVMLRKIRLVGEILDDISGDPWPEREAPEVILVMAKLSEIRRDVALEDELRMYNDLLKAVRTAFKTAPILAKTHPRSSPEKMNRLQQICAQHDVRLYTGQQLTEYVVERSGRPDVTLIGPPSTSLLSAIQFNYGRALCLSQPFMASYIGSDYGNDAWQTMHHQLMEAAGVTIVNSLSELGALVKNKPNKERTATPERSYARPLDRRGGHRMARILYVGDRRTKRANWGCRATSEAVYQLLSQRFEILGTCSNRDFDLRIHDYVCEDPALSLKGLLQKKTSDSFLQSLYDLITRCDAVVFNGEGSIILTTPPWRPALIDLMLIELATYLRKPAFYVNAMVSDSPVEARNEAHFRQVLNSLSKCRAVALRDFRSVSIVNGASPAIGCRFLPDALFTFYKYYEAPEATLPFHPDFIIPFPADRGYWGTMDFSRPYICIGGSSLGAGSSNKPIQPFVELTQAVKTLGLNVYLVPTCEHDHFLNAVAEVASTAILPVNLPVLTGGAILANARIFISGRYHASILASMGGTPCIFLQSNSHKTSSLQEVLEYDNLSEFPLWLTDESIQSILCLCRSYLEKGGNKRDQIRRTVVTRAREAKQLPEFIQERLFHVACQDAALRPGASLAHGTQIP